MTADAPTRWRLLLALLLATLLALSTGSVALAQETRQAPGGVGPPIDARARDEVLDELTRAVPEVASRKVHERVTEALDEIVGTISQREAERIARGAGFGNDDDEPESLEHIVRTIGADALHRRGITGEGVGVALVDTGVAPVPGLADTDLVAGPDLSIESPYRPLRNLDAFGHGTHMAGIIAGNGEGFRGIAPDATLVSVKVGASTGEADASQVIAAVDWVAQHAEAGETPIRVLNLSYGTDGVQPYEIDPLAHAVERAWRAGVVVVVSAGNDGSGPGILSDPAIDPYVLAVGAADTHGTWDRGDDRVPEFSQVGSRERHVDVLAPGKSVVSLRVPGSFLDSRYPDARTDEAYFRGSGTSQSAAIVSGTVALLLEARPDLTPDQVKAVLMRTALRVRGSSRRVQGSGMINAALASFFPAGAVEWQDDPASTGLGSLDGSRGSYRMAHVDGTLLEGEQSAWGPLTSAAWAPQATAGTSWNGGAWVGLELTGTGYVSGSDAEAQWVGSPWEGSLWNGSLWNGSQWNGSLWNGSLWNGSLWNGSLWNGSLWNGSLWNGSLWNGSLWNGSLWNGSLWNGSLWNGSLWNGF